MNVINMYKSVVKIESDDDELAFSNFISGLKYCENIYYFSGIYNQICEMPAISSVQVLPSYKNSNYFTGSDEYESSMKKLNITISSSTGEMKSIAEKIMKNKNITKLCDNIEYDNVNKLSFMLKKE